MTYKTSEALKLELKLLLELDLTPGVQSFPHPGPNSKGVFIFFDMNGNEWTNQKADDRGIRFSRYWKNAVRKTKYYRPLTELQAIRVNDVINDVTHQI